MALTLHHKLSIVKIKNQFWFPHIRLLLGGFILCFFTGPGQSYVISMFNPILLAKFEDISRKELALCYSLATLLASFLLPKFGKYIDNTTGLKPVYMALTCLIIGHFSLGSGEHIFFIFLGYMLTRFGGQGALTLFYAVTITRMFGPHRGKALVFCNLGHPMAQFLFPLALSTLFIHNTSEGNLICILAIIFICWPLTWILLRKYSFRENLFENDFQGQKKANTTRMFKITDLRFYCISYANILCPFIITCIFFHHDYFLQKSNLDINVYVKGISLFGLSQFLGNIIIGPLIDKYSAKKVQFFVLFPIFVGMGNLFLSTSELSWLLFFFLAGFSPPFAGTVKNALWAEVYKIDTLGKIRGLDAQYTILAAAIGPLFFSLLSEVGVTISQFFIMTIAMLFIGIIFHALTTLIFYEND